MDNNNGSPQTKAQPFIKQIFQACFNEYQTALEEAGIIQSDFFGFFIQELFTRSHDGIAALIKQNDQNKEEIINLHTKIEALRQQYDGNNLEQSEQTQQLREVINELQQRKTDLQKEIGQVKREIIELRHSEEENKGERDMLEEEIEMMRIKIKELEQQKLLLEKDYNREYDKRYALEEQLLRTQQALHQLQKQYLEVEGNRQSLSRSLERNKQQLQQLRDIVEESEYLSSLSPQSKPKQEEPLSQKQQQSFNSQNQRQTIEEDIVIRLSQTHLPLNPSQQILELPPKCQRTQTASQHKPIRKMPKSVQSHQKPKKQQSKPQPLLSKAQNKQAVRSQLGSIFKDRLKYRSQHDQQHQEQVEKLKDRVKVKQEEKSKLMAEVAMLKALRTEPVLLPGPSREGLAKFRAENQELRRIARELTMRKAAAQQKYEQERERCEYYKAQHRKIYEKLLLRQAESALLQQQLSLVEHQESSRVDQSEIFDNLSQRFNSLVRHHEVEQPSFRSGAEQAPRCYYSIQNSMQIDQAGDSLTVQNHKQVPIIKLGESLESPAKALPSEESKNMEQLFLQDIEEIVFQPQNQPEVQTERLLLSELMQNSRKQNSFTQCQFLPSDQLRNPLELISLGVLAEYFAVKVAFDIIECESVAVFPQEKRLAFHSLQNCCVLPKNMGSNLELIKLPTLTIPKTSKQFKISKVELCNFVAYPKTNRKFQLTSFDTYTHKPSIKIDFSAQFTSSCNSQSAQTDKETSQAFSNTNLVILSDKFVQINQQLSNCQVNTDQVSSKVAECNTERYQTQQMGVNSKQISLLHAEINTETSINISTLMNTQSIIMHQAESQTPLLIFVDSASEISYNPSNDEGSNTDCINTKQMGVQSNNSQKLLISSLIADAYVHPPPKKLNIIQLIDIILSKQGPNSKEKWHIANIINEIIFPKTKIMLDISINTNNIQTNCLQANTDHISMIDQSTQRTSLNLQFKIHNCINITIKSLKDSELSLLQKIQHPKLGEQSKENESIDKNNSYKLNISSITLPNPTALRDQSYFLPINSQNMLMLSPRTGEYEEKSLNQINSSRTRDSSTQLKRRAMKSPSKIKKAKLKKRKPNQGSFCIQGQVDISLQSINSENPSSQQSFTKSQISSKLQAGQQKTAAQTPYIQKEGMSMSEGLDASKWRVVRQYFYMLKQITLICSNKPQRGTKLVSFKNWAQELYIFNAQKDGEKCDFALWRGRLLRLSSKAPQLLQLRQQKRFLSASGHLLLGNSQVVIANSLLQIKRSRKQRVFRGQMAEGEWKLLHAWTYQIQ